MKILLIIVLFLLIGGFLIISNENIRLNSWNSMRYFAETYYSWLINCYNNGIEITGKVVGFFNH
jgi:hypothetical protein